MKLFNSHAFKTKFLQYFPKLPTTPRILLFGTPNLDAKLFAHRLAIDLGVPAVSMKDIYKTILAFEEYYSTESFYRKVIDILKNHEPEEAAKLLEDNYIPEKLLAATKYTELGYILYDYPNNIKQAQKYLF